MKTLQNAESSQFVTIILINHLTSGMEFIITTPVKGHDLGKNAKILKYVTWIILGVIGIDIAMSEEMVSTWRTLLENPSHRSVAVQNQWSQKLLC
jgi:hypothetical protein